ncbi:MAG: SpoIIE family protein phosphatase [Fibromonadaceae bacterium]|jgi:serine phosphatase RsbU (regulator of sigma subunit)|nr:SpoIIE family protein phosphatase [Fibromonadaceae bacterium]
MILGIIYLVLPFLMAFPASVAFVKWRNSSFKDKQLALEFCGFFSFFLFNLFFSYQYLFLSSAYGFTSKIIDPFFFLFLIQKDLSYTISKKSQKRLLILMFENLFLQIFVYVLSKNVYGYDLLHLFAMLFVIYISLRIGEEYYRTAYIPKISRYLIIALAILCLSFDAHIFRLLLISMIFYVSLERRQSELHDLQMETQNLLVQQTGFKSMMHEISNSIKDFSNKKDAANSYLESLCDFLLIKGAAIYEWESSKNYFSCVAVTGLYFPLGIGSEKLFTRMDLLREIAFKQQIRDQKSMIWKCGHGGAGIHLSHSSDNMEEIFGNLSQEMHSIILIPLLQESELLGVLVLQNKKDNDYLTEADFNVAKAFANFAAIILSTSRMAAQKNENLRMSMELISGNVIQNSLFTHDIPQIDGIDVSFLMLPAKEIGGDYYDFFEKDDKLGVVIGDVSGKGVSAGLLVAIMQTYLQNKYKEEDDLKKLIVGLNDYLSRKIENGMFVTLLFFEWDSRQNKLRYVSCGHEHILHFRSKSQTIERIRSGGLALMMDSDIEPYIKDCELAVEEGDSVILYTDGITETFNTSREIFGLERFVNFFENHPINRNSVEKQLPRLLEDWRGEAMQSDDITCVLMQF